MSAPQHSWQARCAAKRDEIERDTRMLDERKKNRIERLYRELEATNEALVPVEATTARAEGDRDRVVDGKLDLRDRMMRELVIPRSVEQCLETRDDAARYAAHPSLRRISALPPSSGTAPAVGGFPPGLETLCAAYNRIARLSFGPGGAPRLLRVSVAHNCVKFVAKDVDKAPLLEELDLRGNHLPTAQLRHLAPLRRVKRLLLAGNPLSDDRRHSHGLPRTSAAPSTRRACPGAAPSATWRRTPGSPPAWAASGAAARRPEPEAPSEPDARAAAAPANVRGAAPPAALAASPSEARGSSSIPLSEAASKRSESPTSTVPTPQSERKPTLRENGDASRRSESPTSTVPTPQSERKPTLRENGDASKRSESPTSTVRKPTLRERLQKTAAAESASSEEEEEEESEEESEDDDDDESSGSGTVYSEDGPDWVEGWDSNHKHVYYFNVQTEETTWTRPFGEEIRPMSAKDAALRKRDLLKSTNYAGPRSQWGRTPSGSGRRVRRRVPAALLGVSRA
ncbi:exonuclease [Aureococcus anophagefferens]|nr:exonuclease [Aureococcus anophagefferens]